MAPFFVMSFVVLLQLSYRYEKIRKITFFSKFETCYNNIKMRFIKEQFY